MTNFYRVYEHVLLGSKCDIFRRLHPFYSRLVQTSQLKGALSGLIQFLAAESCLKMMRNAFYFTSKALFILKIFKFLS